MDEPQDKRASGRIAAWVLGILMLLVLYFLSSGPAMWLVNKDYISNETMDAVYAPLNWLATVSQNFGVVFIRYLVWWIT